METEHTFRQTVFVRSRIAIEDCGMIAVLANHVRVLGAIQNSQANAGRGCVRI